MSGTPVALKVLARGEGVRLRDRQDIVALVTAAMDLEELDRARAALRVIENRGFNRHRNVMLHLERALRLRGKTTAS